MSDTSNTRELSVVSCAVIVACGVLAAGLVWAAEPEEVAWNFERVGAAKTSSGDVDLGAYSKLAPWPDTDGRYLYSGCYDPSPATVDDLASDRCFSIVDLSIPDEPVRLATVHTYDPVESPAPPPDHVVWSDSYPFPNLPVSVPCRVDWDDPAIARGQKAAPCWDPGWNTHTHYVQKGPGDIIAVNQELYRSGTDRQANYHGIKFYDIADPGQPKFVSYWEAPASEPEADSGKSTDAGGAHHFNFAGNYLYLGTEYEGYIGKILVILDIADPAHPKEAGTWWLRGQKTPEEDDVRNWSQRRNFNFPVVKDESGKWTKHVGMHYVTVHDDVAYLAYHQAGMVILDISDKSAPRLLSHTDYLLPGFDSTNPDIEMCERAADRQPAACGNAHSAKVVPGREDILVMSDEYFTCPYGHVRIFDVSNSRSPKILSHFLTNENTKCDQDQPMLPAEPSRYRPMFFGQSVVVGPSSHLGNALTPNLYLMAWYGAGLKAIDIADPEHPVEAGSYWYRGDRDLGIEKSGFNGPHTYDVVFGKDDRLYVSDASAGLRVLRYTGSRP